MLFRQLFDPETSTYTYLLADEETRDAVLIDPVREQVARDAQLIDELGVTLRAVLETHVHADHVTGGGALRDEFGCALCVGRAAGVLTADRQLDPGDEVRFGRHRLEVRATPGHTDGCVTFVCHEEGMAFTGDALLVRGCGRTDFQQGDPEQLYRSVHEQILTLPDSTRLYPAHDYRGRTMTTVAEEKRFNPRLGSGHTVADFVRTMRELKLAYPARIDEAVPANMASGVTEPEPLAASDGAPPAWAPVSRTTSGVPVILPEWVDAHTDEVRIVDVREHVEFCGPLGHIAGAELVPMATLAEAAAGWDRQQPIVLVCAYGTRSGQAARQLEQSGFGAVASLYGGMKRWADEDRARAEILGGRGSEEPAPWLAMGI